MEASVKVGTFTKQPGERVSNSILYTDALDVDDYIETIISCTATPSGLDVNAGLGGNDRARVWYEGGTNGVDYKVTVVATTHNGERFEDEVICKVREV
jgi:hypothetical protein